MKKPIPDVASVAKVGRVELKRVQLADLVRGDEELQGCTFLRSVGTARSALFERATVRRFASGQSVFAEGGPGDWLLWVLRGELRLARNVGGQALELPVARKGDVVGEREALEATKARSCSVTASGTVELAELPREAVVAAAASAPALWDYLRSVDAERTRSEDELSSFLNRW